MMIIDLPLDGGGVVRAGVIGSCRVYAPLRALTLRTSVKWRFLARGLFSHTVAEAIQELAYFRGLLPIPDPFAPLILNRANAEEPPVRLTRLIGSCQVYLIEISTLEHFACGNFCFNYPALADRLVRGAGHGMMAWFRQLSATPSPPAIVTAALDSLRASGRPADSGAEEMLSSMVRLRSNPETLDEQVARIMFANDRRWILQPLFALPEGGDAKRGALRDHVARAAVFAGAEFSDLTPLVARVGRATALDGGGVDAFHFAPEFLPTVGAALHDILLGAANP